MIGLIAYDRFYGFEKLMWNKEYKDISLDYVTQTKVKLGINFSNKEKLNEIKYKTTCGKIKNDDLEIIWDLTDSTGKCEITASYKIKKIKKEYKIIPSDINRKELFLEDEINLDSDEDLDFDDLTNKEEKEYKTNPILSDSDMDELNDYDEIFTYKTDPNKKDTDVDGLNDYDEIKLSLDPLKSDSKGDGVKDGKRDLTFNYTSDKVQMIIKGKGNIASTVSKINNGTKISSKNGLIDNLYTFYTDGTIKEAVVTISYVDDDLIKYGLNEDNLSIYYYDPNESKYDKIDTIIDKDNNTLTATLKHFSNYVVGDTSLIKEASNSEILFILDNSWSMYTDEQYEKITGNRISDVSYYSSLDGFDSEGLRFSITSNLISSLANKNFQIGLSEFRNDYANALKIGSDEKSLKNKLNNMNGIFITSDEGTNVSNALKNGITEFTKEINNKYIVILTDGQDTSLSWNAKHIIEEALLNNVKICSVGFGGGSLNTELSNISNSTGCKFYSSSNSSGLTELFDNINAELNDNLVDLDGDNNADGILMADSGFVVNRDGFSFRNYSTNLTNGHCYGMAMFAELYYKKQLPLEMPSMTAKSHTSYAYDLNNTYFKNYSNLYDYKLQTNALKYEFGFEIFGEEKPTDLWIVDDKLLKYNSKYQDEINNSQMYEDGKEEKSGLNENEQIKKHGFTYSKYISFLLNEDKMQTSQLLNNEDRQLFNAIYTSFIKQHATTQYSSGSNFGIWFRTALGIWSTGYQGPEGFINILKSRLDDKDVPVIVASFSGGMHGVNAISLVQDVDNPNYYYIGVYDNNYPGEKRYVDVECNNETCVTKENSYYTASGEPIRITPSLEYELEYFN